MAPSGQEPLLVNRAASPGSHEGGMEEDALLTGQRTHNNSKSITTRKQWREIGLFVWALLATAAVVVLAVVFQHSQAERSDSDGSRSGHPKGKRNLIFMVSDGMGPTSLSLTRSWRQYTEDLPFDDQLVLDSLLIGQSRTRSSNSLVTDSAAGATAFSCGQKSYNGAISVLPNHDPCGSVMEAAKMAGYTTGLVVTTRITDATPAVFASHVRKREMEDEIALQMVGETHPLGRMVDLIFGGGRCHFLPGNKDGSCRHDDTDVARIAQDNHNWTYVSSRGEFDKLGSQFDLPMLGLFATGDIPYEIDRRFVDDKYPSLDEMATKALRALSAATEDAEQGFFIMIEGSRIDHAGHANDAAAQVHEVLAYDRTIAVVLDFINKEAKVPTLMVSTSDHETGGLAAARQLHEAYPDYLWYPGVLANASHSSSWTSHQYHAHLQEQGQSQSKEDLKDYLVTLLDKSLGIVDPSSEELLALIERKEVSPYIFAEMMSRRAQTGWSTHGHSAADVNIYTSDPHAAHALRGNHENTEVGEFLRSYLDVESEVMEVTQKLKDNLKVLGESWLGSVPLSDERLDGQDHLEKYHGDHKHKRACDFCEM
ncbi:alkaline phosphatase-like protein [Acrodontium crateriforme]|uniref:Alkaline phosphatase n=1 Tax=Acrodontium crateriforme TaxID=150365 RepID=A0AAQ3RCR2_9PEZI|nr:alkaline phosphatase-like protein [Acrodontium crateriforme]